MPTASAFQQIVHSRLFALSVSDALARALHVSGDFPPLLGDVACDVIAQTAPIARTLTVSERCVLPSWTQ